MCESSDKLMRVIQEAFNSYDTDNDGEVTPEELVAAMAKLNRNITPVAAKKMIEEYDKDKSGTLTIDEFKTMIQTTMKYRGVFNALDTDKSGTLSQEELVQHLKKINVSMSDEEIRCMMISIDKDGDGQIDLKEFTAFLKHLEDEEMADQH